jgi:hypothetical protein
VYPTNELVIGKFTLASLLPADLKEGPTKNIGVNAAYLAF